MAARRRVVVIGSGFAGLAVTEGLASEPVEVTLVDRNNFHTFQPLLYQVATSALNAADVAHPVRGVLHGQTNATFRRTAVTGVDWERRCLHTEHGRPLPFDELVIAAGSATNTFGVPGVIEHGLPLYTLADAVRLRNHVLDRFEAADAEPSLVDDGVLTFVVVGGGPTGVETAGALIELFQRVLAKDFPRLPMHRARVVLVEMGDHVLEAFRPPARRHAEETLRRTGVELLLGDTVERVEAAAVHLRSGAVLRTHTLVWAAGVQASPLAGVLGLPQAGGGRIVVHRDLSVPGHPGVWAAGDIAAATDATGAVLPQLAPVAKQAGRHVAAQIGRRLQGQPTKPFRYRDRGTMATIGRNAAVAELPLRISLRGLPAWLAWLLLHLLFLIGFRNRLSVVVNWAWNYLTWDRGPRLILEALDEPVAAPDSP